MVDSNDPNSPDNRRNSERLPIEDVEVTLTSENNFYTGFTSDISTGGVFIAAHEMLPVGTELHFSLKLGKGVVTCTGVVRWLREPSSDLHGVPPGMGIQFNPLPANVQSAINAFIERRRESIFFDDEPV